MTPSNTTPDQTASGNTAPGNSLPGNTDTLYAQQADRIAGFTFDHQVVDVFPDMIQRSVPGYSTIISMIGHQAERYAQSGTHCYDLGCSLGAATLAMRHRIVAANTRIIAVDNSPAMIERCQRIIDADSGEIPVELRCENIQDTTMVNASVAVMNFTLQFIPTTQRDDILSSVADALLPGGILILSEKIVFPNQQHDELMIEMHHHFKRANGYSDLEIAQKRNALENVLIPETLETHKARLIRAGFKTVDVWFQCFNFASIIAFK